MSTEKRKRDDEYADDLAFIARVAGISTIVGQPDLVLAAVKGWKCIVKKGEFQAGDLAVYCAIGSIPDRMGRVKTVAMGGVMSQGVLGPLSWLKDRGYTDLTKYEEDDSVAMEMNARKHIPKEEQNQYKKMPAHEPFPDIIPKTDSTRLQHDPVAFLAAIQDKSVTVTRKEDGCSCTYYHYNGVTKVCSRNYVWSASDAGASPEYHLMFKKHDLKKKLKTLHRNIAIQGEIVGPGINKNRMKLQEMAFFVFDMFDIDNQRYLGYDEMCLLCMELQLDTVPLLYRGPAAKLNLSLEGFLKLAEETEYLPGEGAEGIVVNSDDEVWRTRRVHFKVISNQYLVKHNL
jgi:RNA ligase (TIGR02306 family)